MNWFKNIFQPKVIVKYVVQRGFAGAQNTRFTSDWITGGESADGEIRFALVEMRNRARNLVNDNDYAKKFVSLCVQNIVGSNGFVLHSTAKDPGGKFDVGANRIIEDAFYDWNKPAYTTVSGTLSFRQVEELVVKHLVVDGECFIKIVEDRYINKYGFAFQIIEPDLIDEKKNETLSNGNFIRMGVELNKYRKPVAYWMIVQDPNTLLYSSVPNGKSVRIPAEEIIHIYDPYRADQTRGVSWLAASMFRLRMLTGFEEASLVNARVSASKMGFFKSMEGLEYKGETKDETGNTITNAEPGTFEQLPPGMDFVPYDPKYPSDQHDAFVKSILRGIASGLGVSYNTLANDLEGVNYSSIRAGLIDERETWKRAQALVVESFLDKFYERWLSQAFLTNNLSNLPDSKFDKFKQHTFIGRRWAWVDPLKDILAFKEANELKIKTRAEIMAELGGDIYETFEQLKLEDDLLKQYGLYPPPQDGMAATQKKLAQKKFYESLLTDEKE